MSIRATTYDAKVLPAALLLDAKLQMRIDHSLDDALIKSMLARAIGRFEQMNGVGLNPATFEWTPGASEFCNDRATVPITPVSQFVAKLADDTDVSSSYSITTKSVYGVPLLHLNGAHQSGVVITLTTGFTAETLPAPVLDIVLRNTAHLYEHREILIPGVEFVSPDMAVDATWWVPRV